MLTFLAVVIIFRLSTCINHVCQPKPFSCEGLDEDVCANPLFKPHCMLKRRTKTGWAMDCKPKDDLKLDKTYKAPSDFSFYFDCNGVNNMGIEMTFEDCKKSFCIWEYKLMDKVINQAKQRNILVKFLQQNGLNHEVFEMWNGNKLKVIHWDPNKVKHSDPKKLGETVKTKGFQTKGQDTYSYKINNVEQSQHEITDNNPKTRFRPKDARIRSQVTAKNKDALFTTSPFNSGVFIVLQDAGGYNNAGSGTFISARVIQTVAHVVAVKDDKYTGTTRDWLSKELTKAGAKLGQKGRIIQPFTQIWLCPAWDGYTSKIKSAMKYARDIVKCEIDKIIISHKYMTGTGAKSAPSDDIAWIVLKNDCTKSYIPIGFLPDHNMFVQDPHRYSVVIRSFSKENKPFETFGYPSDKGEESGHHQWQSRAFVVSDWSKDDPHLLIDSEFKVAGGQSGSGLFKWRGKGYVLVAMCQSVAAFGGGRANWNKISRERYYLAQWITGKSDIGGYKTTSPDSKSAIAHQEYDNENEYIMDDQIVRIKPSYFVETLLSLSIGIIALCIFCMMGCIGFVCSYFVYPSMSNLKQSISRN